MEFLKFMRAVLEVSCVIPFPVVVIAGPFYTVLEPPDTYGLLGCTLSRIYRLYLFRWKALTQTNNRLQEHSPALGIQAVIPYDILLGFYPVV